MCFEPAVSAGRRSVPTQSTFQKEPQEGMITTSLLVTSTWCLSLQIYWGKGRCAFRACRGLARRLPVFLNGQGKDERGGRQGRGPLHRMFLRQSLGGTVTIFASLSLSRDKAWLSFWLERCGPGLPVSPLMCPQEGLLTLSPAKRCG